VDKAVAFPEPGLVNTSISCVTAAAVAGKVLCHGGTTTINVTGTGGAMPYTGTGTFTVGAGTYSYTVTDANGCMSTTKVTVAQPAALVATASNNNPQLYFGLASDQQATVKAVPTGGVAPYKITITMNRPLKCNYLTATGDEAWTATGGTTQNNTCPASGEWASSKPVSSIAGIPAGGAYAVDVSLMEDAVFTITVTDAAGCITSGTTQIQAEDVRCLAGKSGNTKVSICHKTGNPNKPCISICVDEADVAEHLRHGDYLGSCAPNCASPAASTSSIQARNGGALDISITELDLQVVTNPARGHVPFKLRVTSNNMKDGISLRVMNGAGKVVTHKQSIRPGQTFDVGASYLPGMYFAEVLQGQKRKVVKLLKQ
jgi:hypothetical protein